MNTDHDAAELCAYLCGMIVGFSFAKLLQAVDRIREKARIKRNLKEPYHDERD